MAEAFTGMRSNRVIVVAFAHVCVFEGGAARGDAAPLARRDDGSALPE